MIYKKLGHSNLDISRIGFGCMSLKDDQPYNEKLLHHAIDKGINYFDTADLYDKGLNEEWLGKAVKSVRDKVIIATKVGNKWRSDGSGFDWNPSKKYILTAVEASLQRLQTDYIDLYQLHGGTIEDPIDEVIEAFELLQQQGKIRYYGISSIRPNVIRAYVEKSKIASVMMQYSLLDRRPEESILTLLETNNIGVLARGSVAGGLLIDKEPKPYLNYNESQVAQGASSIKKLSTSSRLPSSTAIQFALHHKAITAAVVGIRSMEQLDEALNVFTSPQLNNQDIDQLKTAIPANVYEQHR